MLDLAGTCLITDPVLRPRIAHLRRQVPAPDPPARLDAVLLSHLHRDHLDLPTLRTLDSTAPVLVPRGAGFALRRTGREIVELAVGERHRIGAVEVLATPALHDGRRFPVGGRAADAIGYIVEGEGLRTYFCGDTELFDGMAELAPLDVALLPVWGWGPSLGPGHMDPEQAAEATALLRPTLAIPIHWGTFLPAGQSRRLAHLLDEPPRRYVARCAELAPATEVRVLMPGESLALRP